MEQIDLEEWQRQRGQLLEGAMPARSLVDSGSRWNVRTKQRAEGGMALSLSLSRRWSHVVWSMWTESIDRSITRESFRASSLDLLQWLASRWAFDTTKCTPRAGHFLEGVMPLSTLKDELPEMNGVAQRLLARVEAGESSTFAYGGGPVAHQSPVIDR